MVPSLSNLPGTGPPHINRLCSSSQTPPPDTSFYQWVHVFLILQVESQYTFSLEFLKALAVTCYEGSMTRFSRNYLKYINRKFQNCGSNLLFKVQHFLESKFVQVTLQNNSATTDNYKLCYLRLWPSSYPPSCGTTSRGGEWPASAWRR